MLYILTGDIQTGKTRWLQSVLAALEEQEIVPYGVIAPGQWISHCENGRESFEKLGIDNELLPQHELIPFARRADLLSKGDVQKNCSQAQRAQLGWAIDDSAIQRVNEHLKWVFDATGSKRCERTQPECSRSEEDQPELGWAEVNQPETTKLEANSDEAVQHEPNRTSQRPSLLVIDELGRLELLKGEGLTNALALVERGATPTLPHALIIVREQLFDQAKARFADAPWGGIKPIGPTQETREEILERILAS